MSEQTTGVRWPDWLLLAIIGMVIFNGLPFLAPVFMEIGLEPVGKAIYTVYIPLCHQMAQRSFFLFGPEGFQMYEISQLPLDLSGMTAGQEMLALRSFRGSEELGWKVAWSDRMVYMYAAPLLFAIVYAVWRDRIKPLPVWAFGLMLLPMAIDGGTHWLSDLPGLTAGFRYHNAWLADLTNNAFAASFYAGDSLGSFNSWMRLLSGVFFGVGIGWFAFPHIDGTVDDIDDAIEERQCNSYSDPIDSPVTLS